MADFTTTDRGFKHYEPLHTNYGHELGVYESSAASMPCLWLKVDATHSTNGDDGEMTVHLTLNEAKALRKALKVAINGHYQR